MVSKAPLDKIAVVIRVRPLIAEELAEDPKAKLIVVKPHSDQKSLTLQCASSLDRMFSFDRVLHYSNTTQESFYQRVAEPMVQETFRGINATIIAYGQTGSGKTYTVFGSSRAINYLNETHPEGGLVPRSVSSLFEKIEQNKKSMQFLITCSFMEIYLESLVDLFTSKKARSSLHIRETPSKGVYVEGLTEVNVRTQEELLDLLKAAAKTRATGSTMMNKTSSRSHAILRISLQQRFIEEETGILRKHHKRALLTIVDLAGSERLSRSKSTKNRLEEAKMINKSISALGNCINALIYPKRFRHVPFRDSKLTRVLTESLGGNSRTTLVACVSPSMTQSDETLSTLLFANSAKSVNTFAVVNEVVKIRSESPMNKSFHGTTKGLFEEPNTELAKRNAMLETENISLKNTIRKLWENTEVDYPIDYAKAKARPKSAMGIGENMRVELDSDDTASFSSKALSGDEQRTVEKIKEMIAKIKDLQEELTEKNIVIQRLKKENAELSPKAQGTGFADIGKQEAVIDQLLSIPQLRNAMISKLRDEGSFCYKEEDELLI